MSIRIIESKLYVLSTINIIIIIMFHWYDGFPWLSLAICPNHPFLLPGLLHYILCPYRSVVGQPMMVCPFEGVHRITSLMSLSLFLQQYSPYIVCLIWMVLKIGGRWSYSCCFMGCCLQNLFNTVHIILVLFLINFFSKCFVSIHVLHV